jgi:cytochrome c-type biogenesis protein CcsB
MPVEKTAGIAILSGGRIKPLQTFAEESLLMISGKTRIDGFGPLQVLWGFHFNPVPFRGKNWIRMDNQELKKISGFPLDKRRFSFNALMASEGFKKIAKKALEASEKKRGLSPVENDALSVYAKLERVAGFVDGSSLNIVPRLNGDGSWSTPSDLQGLKDPLGQAVLHSLLGMSKAWKEVRPEAFGESAQKLTLNLRKMGGRIYPSLSALNRELFYNNLDPFGWAWKTYLVGFLILLFFGFKKDPLPRHVGLALIFTGFAFHSFGIGLRWAIAGRAPVSDMYESLVFMSWGVLATGIVLEFLYNTRFFIFGASLMGFLALVFSEHLPLDSSINPLVPVLAHTSWLSIHVMTIMLSYSSFILAMGLAHIVLAIQVFRPGKTQILFELSSLLYKSLQVGVLFLAAGIAFGAIWANESWGRYWGWDPKETWSLITFFVYMIIIHARFAGWVGHFGLATLSILGFLSVVMTYYGVNFLLASGLHSYGFSSGGTLFAGVYVLAELGVMLGAWIRFRKATGGRRLNQKAS